MAGVVKPFSTSTADEKTLRRSVTQSGVYSGTLDEHGINAQIQARQLYHDREK